MGGVMSFAYGLTVYMLLQATSLDAIGFVGNLMVPQSTGASPAAPFGVALLTSVGLLSLFAAQHSSMPRKGSRSWWTRIGPVKIEQSTLMLSTCVVLALPFWQWRSLPGVVWNVEQPLGQLVMGALFWSGWLLVLVATFLINRFDLFGLRQV